MKKVLVIGCFGDKTGRLDGQIVKTRDIYAMLEEKLHGEAKLDKFNTLSVRENKFLLAILLIKLLWCNKVVLIPADHNLEKFFPLLYRLSSIVKYEIIQLCVGGWQVDFFIGRGKWAAHPSQMEMSKKCKAFLPEIKKVNEELKSICGFENCEVFPNFRRNIPNVSHVNDSEELRLVWLARINKKKGFEIVFNLANKIEKEGLNISITFFGKIAEEDEDLFNSLMSRYHSVSYKGQLSADRIAETLCDYDVVVLPTQYYTEGFPGTVLDANISGLPVIATEWMHAHEFIEDGVSGFVVPFENPQEEFNKRIIQLYNDRDMLDRMKRKSRERVVMYTEDRAWDILRKYL